MAKFIATKKIRPGDAVYVSGTGVDDEGNPVSFVTPIEHPDESVADMLRLLAGPQLPKAPALKLLADEDLPIGVMLKLTGEPFIHDGQEVTKVVAARSGTELKGLIGAAVRNIRKGEVIDYDPEGKTADIFARYVVSF